jgi:hypothetical protein
MELEVLNIIKKHTELHGRAKYKKRKKELEKNEKKQNNVYRAHYSPILKPQKFMNPYKIYRLYTDHAIIEDCGKFYTDMIAVSQWKYLSTVNINHKIGLVNVTYENNSNYMTPPWEYLAARMRSFGDVESVEWANALEDFGVTHDQINKNKRWDNFILNRSSIPPSNMLAISNTKEYLINNTMVAIFRFNFASPEGQMCGAGYNHVLAKCLGYKSLDEFTTTLKKDGYISLFYIEKSYVAGYQNYLKAFYKNDPVVAVPIVVLTKERKLLPVLLTMYWFASKNEKK